MRSNGLTAPAYTPVADLDPVLATALLGELKAQGVAAYTKPVESTTTSGFDRPEFRDRVRDRLYVDAEASARVRELLADRDPELLDGNEDLTWAQLVAGFDQPLVTDVPPWPLAEGYPDPDTGLDDAPARPPRFRDPASEGKPPFAERRHKTSGWDRGTPGDDLATPTPRVDPGSDDDVRPHSGGFDDADFLASTSQRAQADDIDRFVPEPPPPLPRLAPHRQVAWLGVLGGPVLLLFAALFQITPPDWLAFFSVLAFIGGFITLVATMSGRDDGDWGSGNGAVV